MTTHGGEVGTMGSELMTIADLGHLLRLSRTTLQRMLAAGRLPAPLKLSKACSRWHREEIERWVRAGCPDRAAWDSLKAAR